MLQQVGVGISLQIQIQIEAQLKVQMQAFSQTQTRIQIPMHRGPTLPFTPIPTPTYNKNKCKMSIPIPALCGMRRNQIRSFLSIASKMYPHTFLISVPRLKLPTSRICVCLDPNLHLLHPKKHLHLKSTRRLRLRIYLRCLCSLLPLEINYFHSD